MSARFPRKQMTIATRTRATIVVERKAPRRMILDPRKGSRPPECADWQCAIKPCTARA